MTPRFHVFLWAFNLQAGLCAGYMVTNRWMMAATMFPCAAIWYFLMDKEFRRAVRDSRRDGGPAGRAGTGGKCQSVLLVRTDT